MYFDTHAHIYLPQFDDDRHAVVQRALDLDIKKILMPNVDLETVDSMHALALEFPGVCYPMMGLHPCSVTVDFERDLLEMESLLDKKSYCAIGEIGIDLYWDKTFVNQQVEAFKLQVHWAHQRSLPVVIHSRESIDQILDLLEREALPGLQGVFHCFTGDENQAERIVDLGFYLGIGGVVTFKNAGLDKTLSRLDLDRIVLETDAPYLAPHPNRGKRNESSYIRIIADRICEIRDISDEALAKLTTQNAMKLFRNLDQPK